jgi:hypothetical protein
MRSAPPLTLRSPFSRAARRLHLHGHLKLPEGMDDLHGLLALVSLGRVLRHRRKAHHDDVEQGPPTEVRLARDALLAAKLRRSLTSPRPGASHAALMMRLRRSIATHPPAPASEIEPSPATLAHGNMAPPSTSPSVSFDPHRWEP